LSSFDPIAYRGESFALFDLAFLKKAISDLKIKPKNKVITVRGTNGKTSTSLFLDSIIRQNKFSCIAFISPHVFNPNERILVNGTKIAISLLSEFDKLISIYEKSVKRQFTYFEALFLICLFLNKQEKVDYLVLEAGLGGPKDATASVLSDLIVLTSIGLDHQEFLGDTREKILKSKTSDIKDVQLITFSENKKYKGLFLKNVIYVNSNSKEGFLEKNKILAIAAANFLKMSLKEDDLKLDFHINGRFQVLRKKPFLVLDGAHNREGLIYLFENLKDFKIKRALVGMKKGKLKDCEEVIRNFGFDEIAWCDLPQPWDSDSPPKDWDFLKTDSEILEWVLKSKKDSLIVGSLYLSSRLLKLFNGKL